MKSITAAWIMCVGLCTAIPAAAQTATVTGPPAVADTITHLLDRIAEATARLDVDRLLTYYEQSDALTYVARGTVTRSWAAFADLVTAQLQGLRGAELTWLDTYVDVLSTDVAVATATYELTATLPDGRTVPSSGAYTCIFTRRDGRWLVRHSQHSFPQRQP